jgi:hypothetical protein
MLAYIIQMPGNYPEESIQNWTRIWDQKTRIAYTIIVLKPLGSWPF